MADAQSREAEQGLHPFLEFCAHAVHVPSDARTPLLLPSQVASPSPVMTLMCGRWSRAKGKPLGEGLGRWPRRPAKTGDCFGPLVADGAL